MAIKRAPTTQGLSKQQLRILQENSPKPNDILNNMDALNEEIAETYDANMIEQADVVYEEEDEEISELDNITYNSLMSGVEEEEEEAMEIDDFDIDAELNAAQKALDAKQAALAAKAAEEAKQAPVEEAAPEDRQKNAILDLMKKIPGAPNAATIEKLKQRYGDDGVHVLALGEKDVYLFTYLRRGSWQKIQTIVQAAQSSDVTQSPEELMKEKVLQSCLLWPEAARKLSPEFLYNSRAGVVDTLYQSVLLHSYFLNPQQAMMLTAQL